MESLILLAVMMGVLWLLLIRPQQRQQRAHRELISKLEVGDDVLTSAGIYGQVTELDGGTVFLAISDQIEVKVTRESVVERINYGE